MIGAEIQSKVWDWVSDKGLGVLVLIIVAGLFWYRTEQNYSMMLKMIEDANKKVVDTETKLYKCYESRLEEYKNKNE